LKAEFGDKIITISKDNNEYLAAQNKKIYLTQVRGCGIYIVQRIYPADSAKDKRVYTLKT